MILANKVAVVFAAGGAIASHVAQAFAAEGAEVFLSGKTLISVEAVADAIVRAGGRAEAAEVDALDEAAIDAYLQSIVDRTGRLDVVFNGIGLRPSLSGYGTPSTALSFTDFLEPLRVHVGSQFLTSRVAARHLMRLGSGGTILTLTASLSRLKVPFMAGISSACAGIEGLTRVLAAEFGRAGIRVICLNPTALYETRTIHETNEASARAMGIPTEALQGQLQSQYLLGHSPTLPDVGAVAAFLASDAGAALNSHVVDVDGGTMMVI